MLISELNDEGESQVEYVYLNGQRIAILMTSTTTTPATGPKQFYIVNQANGLKLKAGTREPESFMRVYRNSDESDWVKFERYSSGDGYYYLKNVISGLYFRPLRDILPRHKNPNAHSELEQRPTTFNGKRTQWQVLSAGSNDEIYLRNRWSQDYLQAPNGQARDKPRTKKTRTDPSAKWKFVVKSKGQLRLISVFTYNCLNTR